MKIHMLDTVEDTNPEISEAGGRPVVVYRTDKLLKGQAYDLPDNQAARLVKMKMAKAI